MADHREEAGGDGAEFAARTHRAQGSWATRKSTRAQETWDRYARPPAGLHKWHRQTDIEKGMRVGRTF